jgi:hypothetical protein
MDVSYCKAQAQEAEELAKQMSSSAARVAMLAQAQRWRERAKLLEIVTSSPAAKTPFRR